MKPKGKLFALFAIFAAIGLVTATGAFSTVTAQRTASVSTAGDSSALLGLEDTDNPGAGYITKPSDQIQVNFDNVAGVNKNAVTWVNKSIKITNNGENTVYVWVTHNGNGGSFAVYNGTHNVSAVDGSTPSEVAELSQGASVIVSIQVDTLNPTSVSLPDNVNFHAEDSIPSGASSYTP